MADYDASDAQGVQPRNIPLTREPTDDGADRTDPRAQIERIRGDKSHAYHRGNPAALDEMNTLYQQAYGKPDADQPNAAAFTRPTAKYELASDLPEDAMPTLIRQDVEGTTFDLGFDRQTAQGVFDWALGRASAPPDLPPTRITPDAAAKSLRAEWGADYDRQLGYARAGVAIFDEIRRQGGHGQGQIRETLERTGYANDPKTLKFFSRLGGYYKQTQPTLFRQFAARRSAARRQADESDD